MNLRPEDLEDKNKDYNLSQYRPYPEELTQEDKDRILEEVLQKFRSLEDEGDQMLSGDWEHGREGKEGRENRNRGILGNIWERTGYKIIQWVILNTRRENRIEDLDPLFVAICFGLGIVIGILLTRFIL